MICDIQLKKIKHKKDVPYKGDIFFMLLNLFKMIKKREKRQYRKKTDPLFKRNLL